MYATNPFWLNKKPNIRKRCVAFSEILTVGFVAHLRMTGWGANIAG